MEDVNIQKIIENNRRMGSKIYLLLFFSGVRCLKMARYMCTTGLLIKKTARK
ncbi:hypothetical protein SAMN05192529_12121 [Arachidicoccus rhizosphaerae]|uniref:Uncharacterized protein n=1 Tax=Arachidicoccus rhizosphaerae TaxID=551991 RepID=A0A1H4BH79_9BACT|nr:hypothetical protein SAMN05192529_12121 [Arachidicoccus rhizosphaerae]